MISYRRLGIVLILLLSGCWLWQEIHGRAGPIVTAVLLAWNVVIYVVYVRGDHRGEVKPK